MSAAAQLQAAYLAQRARQREYLAYCLDTRDLPGTPVIPFSGTPPEPPGGLFGPARLEPSHG